MRRHTETQINNLKIRYSKVYGKWQVITPSGRVLDEVTKKEKAISFAKGTKDFLRRSKRSK